MFKPMRIKLTVKRVEIVAPFYMDMRFRLTLARYVPHMAPDSGRTLGRRVKFVWCGRAKPAHTTRISSFLQEKGLFDISNRLT